MLDPPSSGTSRLSQHFQGHNASFPVCSSLLSPLLCTSWLELRAQAAPHASAPRLTLQSQGQQFVFPHPKFTAWEGCQASSAKTEASVGVSFYRSDGALTPPTLICPRGPQGMLLLPLSPLLKAGSHTQTHCSRDTGTKRRDDGRSSHLVSLRGSLGLS